MAVMYTREDWTLFRNLGTLTQKAGVGQDHLAQLIVKELVDNALDAAGACDVGLLEGNGFFVEDRGDGIPGCPEEIADLFSIRRPLVSSKLLRLPTRGALGNGLRVVTGAILATGGRLYVHTRGRSLQLTPKDDGATEAEALGAWGGAGTRVEVFLGPSLPVTEMSLRWAKRAIKLAQGEDFKGKTSPFWYDVDSFFELCQAAGDRSVRDLIADFDGCSGKNASMIAAGFLGQPAGSLTRDEAEALLSAARQIARPFRAKRLGKVGDFVGDGPPTYYYASTDKWHVKLNPSRGALEAKIPLVIEAWVTPDRRRGAFFHVNKSPITVDMQTWEEKQKQVVYGGGFAYEYSIGRLGQVEIWVNIQTPYMPITTDGKAPDLRALARPLEDAIQAAINRAKRGRPKSWVKVRTQKEVILDYLDQAVADLGQGGRYRFSQRQLFYAIRPFLLEETGKEPNYDYFAQVITEYEGEAGDIPGLYRDPRGTLYVPHIGEEVPLGTLYVESFRRPDWTFNKVLYSEKEGFFSILRADGWPERHDCALLTSKGQASRAAKDLIDQLGETDEPLTFFCIHDADAAGTVIYQALQEATKARPGRTVSIVNLGLEPWEAVDLGLQVERVTYQKRQPVADYVDGVWADWLQENRVELNAMSTATFIGWLDGKLADYGGKVIPPADVMKTRLVGEVQDRLRRQIIDQVIRQAGVDKQVDQAFAGLRGELDAEGDRLPRLVADYLEDEPTDNWQDPVALSADVLAGIAFNRRPDGLGGASSDNLLLAEGDERQE